MRIYIDSNTFPAAPGLYADAAKTKPLPRLIPAVELQRGGFAVAFIGENGPKAGETLALAASIESSGVQVVAEFSDEYIDGAWEFDFALNSQTLASEVAKRGSVRLLVGIISEDDAQRREWQFSTVVYPSASSEETDTEAVESAKNFAELAQRAATQATEAQESVAGNAQLAESAKQTATQAANAAIEAADNAEVSERNAAESKGAAEKAKTDAEAAKAEAKKAASDAQATLGNVYTKAQIDGVDTGAEVTVKMNEIIAQLKDYEAVTGETLPNEFWVEVFNAFERWLADPSEVKEWVTTSATESTNPYFSEAPTKPVVDFNVKLAKSTHSLRVASFNPNTNVDVYLPSATNISDIMSFSTKRTGRIIAPNAAYADYLVCGNTEEYTETIYLKTAVSIRYIANSAQKFNGRVIARKAKDATGAFYLAYAYNQDTRFESADNCFALLSNALAFEGTLEVPLCQRADRIVENCRKFNHSVYLPLCLTAKDGFKGTAMSAENISATLDSLPTWTDGESHVITFTGSPGCAELTQESPSVAAAIAKGWTVEL